MPMSSAVPALTPRRIERLGGDLRAPALLLQVEKELHELSAVLFFQRGELLAEQTIQTVLRDGRHLNDDKARGERFIQLARAGVAVVHRADEARGGVDRHAVVAGNVDGAAEVERRVQYSKRLIFCHVDLVEHAEATMLCAKVHGAGAEADLAALERVHADEARGVHVHVERHVPCGTGEDLGEVFRQYVFARGLTAREQQVLPAQNGGDRLFPHVLAIIMIPRLRDAVLQLRRRRILRVKFTNAIQKVGTQPLLFQKI